MYKDKFSNIVQAIHTRTLSSPGIESMPVIFLPSEFLPLVDLTWIMV
jgi:hypothetical protein